MHSTFSRRWLEAPNGSIPLTTAEMDFSTDPDVLKAIYERLRYPLNYPPTYQSSGVTATLSTFYARSHGLALDEDDFWVVDGVIPASSSMMAGLLDVGDHVIFLSPAYYAIPGAIVAGGCVPVPVPIDDRHGVDLQKLTAAAASARAIYLTSPHNPTGYAFSRDELADIVDIAAERGLLVISNELHSRISLDARHETVLSIGDHVDRVVLSGATKSHNLSGLGGGFVVSSDSTLMARIRDSAFNRVGVARSLQQAALQAAYRFESPWLQGVHVQLRRNRGVLASALHDHLGLRVSASPATYFLWVQSARSTDPEPASVLARHGVHALPGSTFGVSDDFARICFGSPGPLIDEVVARISAD